MVHTMKLTLQKWHSKLQLLWHLKKAGKQAKSVILEPIMKVEITVPEGIYG